MKKHLVQARSKKISFTALRDTALEASQAAGSVLMRRFRTKLQISEKLNAGIVTNADFESERAALKILKRRFPDFGILTEESKPEESKGLGKWIIDPLDGTTNFARGLTTFCVSIAAEWDNQIVAGVIYHPVSGEIFSCIKGKGAFVGKKRIHVSKTKRLQDAFLSTGFNSNKDKYLSQEISSFERVSRITGAVRRPGSAALDLAYVARGVFDGFWERGLAPWDIAAGLLLVEEAGGKVSDFSGSKLQLDSREIIASNGLLHSLLLQTI